MRSENKSFFIKETNELRKELESQIVSSFYHFMLELFKTTGCDGDIEISLDDYILKLSELGENSYVTIVDKEKTWIIKLKCTTSFHHKEMNCVIDKYKNFKYLKADPIPNFDNTKIKKGYDSAIMEFNATKLETAKTWIVPFSNILIDSSFYYIMGSILRYIKQIYNEDV